MSEENVCALRLTGETLASWQDRLLGARDMARLNAHVPTCVACQERIAQFVNDERLLRGQRELVPGNRVWGNVQLLASQSRRQRNFLVNMQTIWNGAAAIALITLAAVVAQVLHGRPNAPVISTLRATSTSTATATALPAPTCASMFSSGYYSVIPDPHYTATQVYANVPLPPLARIVANDAAGGQRGYEICSAGTVASITAYMDTNLAHLGWINGGIGTWTKNGYSLKVQITSATDWLISWRDPDFR